MNSEPIVWLVPEERGGICDYSDELWPYIEELCSVSGWQALRVNAPPVRTRKDITDIVATVRRLNPSLIHVQHEFGLFGSKLPFLYQFPQLARELTTIAPCLATAHNVLAADYELPWKGKGWQVVPRWFFNRLVIPFARRAWREGTWGLMQGVVVHSHLQANEVRSAGCASVQVIPHFVPVRDYVEPSMSGTVVVFGFFTAEKGQDVIIRAWKHLPPNGPSLVLAGSVRRAQDQRFFDTCTHLIRELELEGRVTITGYVPADRVGEVYASASLVVAPFRETSGSGSLAQALGRGAAILASDLPLNKELNERMPGCLALFRSEDPEDCARKISELLANPTQRARLSDRAKAYALEATPQKIAMKHLEYYRVVLSS